MQLTVLVAVACAALVIAAPVENKKTNLTSNSDPDSSPLPLSRPFKFLPSGTFSPLPVSSGTEPPYPPPSSAPKSDHEDSGKARRAGTPPGLAPDAPKVDHGGLNKPSNTTAPPAPSSGTPKPEHGGSGKTRRADAPPPPRSSSAPLPPPAGTPKSNHGVPGKVRRADAPPPPPSSTVASPPSAKTPPKPEHEGSGKARRSDTHLQPVVNAPQPDHGHSSKPPSPLPSGTPKPEDGHSLPSQLPKSA